MTAKNLKIKKHKKMPFNYSLYPVNVIVKDKEIQDESTFPKEFVCMTNCTKMFNLALPT